jgi:hypothetical protein
MCLLGITIPQYIQQAQKLGQRREHPPKHPSFAQSSVSTPKQEIKWTIEDYRGLGKEKGLLDRFADNEAADIKRRRVFFQPRRHKPFPVRRE